MFVSEVRLAVAEARRIHGNQQRMLVVAGSAEAASESVDAGSLGISVSCVDDVDDDVDDDVPGKVLADDGDEFCWILAQSCRKMTELSSANRGRWMEATCHTSAPAS